MILAAADLWAELAELFEELPELLGGHLLLSVSAVAVAAAISLPLGVIAASRPRLAGVILTAAGIVQTVPSLALLALMVPLLGGMIGFVPAFAALTVYGLLPILRNTVVGLREVNPALVEAARGVGMSERQSLFRVRLPLAAPVILAGLRTAVVLTVGTATLATPVGGESLGRYIFQGLQTRNHVSTVFGCVFAAVLAVVLDQLVRLLEAAARRRSRKLLFAGVAGLGVVLAGGLAPTLASLRFGPRPVVVGSKPFTEQFILAEALTRRLEAAGFEVDARPGLGTNPLFEGITRGSVDCYVGYTGTLWTAVLKRKGVADPDTTLAEVTRELRQRHGVVCLGRLGFENAYCLAMRRSRAEQLGIRSLADLARRGDRLKLGVDMEFTARPDWVRVRDGYGLDRLRIVGMDANLMYQAVGSGAVDVISAYSSDGRIAAMDLVVLDDPKRAFPPYDAVLLLSARAASKPELVEALRPLLDSVGPDAMRRANKAVDVDKASPAAAARELLDTLGG
jgi:osmoprotectant transport system permease protein